MLSLWNNTPHVLYHAVAECSRPIHWWLALIGLTTHSFDCSQRQVSEQMQLMIALIQSDFQESRSSDVVCWVL